MVVKEKGLRAQEQSRETAHKQDGEACFDTQIKKFPNPTNPINSLSPKHSAAQTQAAEMPKVPAHLKNQKMLDDYNDRSERPQEPQQIDPKQHQNNQASASHFLQESFETLNPQTLNPSL